jgi:heme exporter protein C
MVDRQASRASSAGFVVLLGACAASLLGALHVIFLRAPVEASMGIVQKIFYFHVPAACGMYLGAGICFVGSASYLARGRLAADALARAGAEVAVVMGMMVLVSGPLWASRAWGRSWVWEPRLTTALLSVLVYASYVLLRAFSGRGEAPRRFAAALGVLGAANLPIIHYSVRKWGGQHPSVLGGGGGGLGHPDMTMALGLGLLSFTLLGAALAWQRLRLHLMEARLEAAEQEALALGLVEGSR